jgi:hypothetical protein
MSEETLAGGNTVGALRIGDIVHKQAWAWTPTVHALLRHLEDAGFDGAPRALGFDDQGREMLTYLPGETAGGRFPWPAWAFTDATLTQVGQWLRRVHDVTADFVPPADERWFAGSPRSRPAWPGNSRWAGTWPCLRCRDRGRCRAGSSTPTSPVCRPPANTTRSSPGGCSGWMIAAVPAAAALVRREVREERMLEDAFGDEFRRYRAAVPGYLPRRCAGARRLTGPHRTGITSRPVDRASTGTPPDIPGRPRRAD